MEPASFALTIAGVPEILKSYISTFNYIQLGRIFRKDFGICIAKLQAADLQLSRWGEAMGFLGEPFDPGGHYKKGLWHEKGVKKANKWLGLISDLLKDAKKATNRFKSKHEDDEPELLEVPNQATALDKSKHGAKKLVHFPTTANKTKWALYARDDFDKLVKDISELVEKLVVLFPALQPEQEALCQKEAEQIDPEVIPTLITVLGGKDKLLNHALAEEVKTKRHRLQGIKIQQGGVTNVGDSFKNVFDMLAPGADVSDADVSGTLKVGHQYEISYLMR